MINRYFVLITLLCIYSCDKESVSWYNGNLEEASTIANDKIIMIDFYTDW